MPDFNEMKKKAGEAAEFVAGQAINFAKVTGEKVTLAAKVARLKAEIIGEKDIIRKSYQKIGKLYVEQFADTPHDVMLADVEKVSQAQQRIEVIKEEIERLKTDGAVTSDDAEIFDEVDEDDCDDEI